jgi:predicted MFS family arabinose efflux permease
MEDMNLSTQRFGFVASVYGYCAAGAGLLAAIYMDRFDRKRSLLFLYGGFIVATFFCGFATNYPLLLLGRGLAGTFGGIVGAVTMAIIGDSFHDSRRGKAMGMVMSAFSVANIFGVPIGLESALAFGTWAPFVGIGVLATIVLIGVAIVMPPMRGHLTRSAIDERVSLWELFTHSRFLRAYGLMAAMMVSGFVFAPFMTKFLVSNVGRSKEDLKYVYLCAGLATVITTNVFGRLSDRYGKLRVFRILASATIIPFLAFTNLPPVSLGVVLIVVTLLWILSAGRMVPGMALIVAAAAPRYRGQFQSACTVVQHLSMALGASLGGYIVGEGANGQLTRVGWVGVVGTVFVVLSVVLAGKLRPAPSESTAKAAQPSVEATPESEPQPEIMMV